MKKIIDKTQTKFTTLEIKLLINLITKKISRFRTKFLTIRAKIMDIIRRTFIHKLIIRSRQTIKHTINNTLISRVLNLFLISQKIPIKALINLALMNNLILT